MPYLFFLFLLLLLVCFLFFLIILLLFFQSWAKLIEKCVCCTVRAAKTIPLGYPDIRQDFRGKGASAPSGGYPLALADICQGIAGIRDGYPLTISTLLHNSCLI
jgi:hypothetical protein